MLYKKANFLVSDLLNVGFNLTDLKKDNFNVAVLKSAGRKAFELKKAGFSPKILHDPIQSEKR